MTRIVLGLVVVLLLAACTSDGGSDVDGSGDGPDARTVKTEMDGEAEALLPDLVDQVGGELNGMQATFTERGGFGVWDYRAGGALVGPSGTTTESLTAAQAVLEEHGYTVQTNDSQKRVTGTKGNVTVIVPVSVAPVASVVPVNVSVTVPMEMLYACV